MRNKVSLILYIICIFILAGCGKKTEVQQADFLNVNNAEDTTANSSYGYESYVGTYYSENGTPETIYTKGGSCIEIQSVYGNNVKFIITAISSAPNNRIAIARAEGSVGENGIVNFTYSDDGWGNSGTGAIVLKNDKVVVTSSMKKADSSAMWKLPDYDNSLFVRK